jgi:hypothetical protein
MADPTYTVFIRVPMPRGDFVDPAQVSSSGSLPVVMRQPEMMVVVLTIDRTRSTGTPTRTNHCGKFYRELPKQKLIVRTCPFSGV